MSKLSTPLRPQAQLGPTRHPHSRLFLVTLPGQGALWRQALPRRSRNTTAAVRERNAQRQCLSRHSLEHGGERPGGPPNRKHPRVLAPRWSLQCPQGQLRAFCAAGKLQLTDQANRWGFRLPTSLPAGPSLHLGFLLAVQSSGPHWGSPQGSLCLGHSEETEQGGAQKDRARGFPAGIS